MAVVPRKRAGKRTVFGVLTSWSGGKDWRLVGPNRREADALDKLSKREVKAGTFKPASELTDAASVAAFAKRWLDGRKNRSADNDYALITRHVLKVEWFASMPIGSVKAKDVNRLAKQLGEGTLSVKSVSLVMGLVRVMFRDAVIDDVIQSSPYMVPRGTLKRSGKKRAPYPAADALALMSAPVGERERMWNALAFYTGARCGEICGLTWGDWDERPVPLGSLTITKQYAGEVLKTERPRVVPVHPELEGLLVAWRERWSFFFLSRPGPTDLIVPRVAADGTPDVMTKSAAYKAWLRSCKAAGVTNLSVHSTRHTFITETQRCGADKSAVELVTHNPKGTIIDRYTHKDWSVLCQAVACLSFDAPLDGPSPDFSNYGSRAWTRTSGSELNTGEKAVRAWKQANQGTLESGSNGSGDARVDARRTRLLRLAEVDPEAAAPGLAVCEGLEKVRSGDLFGAVELLRKEATRGS